MLRTRTGQATDIEITVSDVDTVAVESRDLVLSLIASVTPEVLSRLTVDFLRDGGVQVSLHHHDLPEVQRVAEILGLRGADLARNDHLAREGSAAFTALTWAGESRYDGGVCLVWFTTAEAADALVPAVTEEKTSGGTVPAPQGAEESQTSCSHPCAGV